MILSSPVLQIRHTRTSSSGSLPKIRTLHSPLFSSLPPGGSHEQASLLMALSCARFGEGVVEGVSEGRVKGLFIGFSVFALCFSNTLETASSYMVYAVLIRISVHILYLAISVG